MSAADPISANGSLVTKKLERATSSTGFRTLMPTTTLIRSTLTA